MGRSNYSTNGLLNAVTKRAFNRYTPTTVDYQHLEAATTTSGLVSNRREYSSALLLADTFSLNSLNLAQANYDPFLKSILSTDWEDTLKELSGESGFNTGLDISMTNDGTKLAVITRDKKAIYLNEGNTEIKVYNYDSTRYDLASPENVATHTYQSVSYTISGIDSTDDGHQVVAVLNDQALQKFSLSETNVLTSDTRFSFGPLGGTGDLTVNLSHDGKRVFVFQPGAPARVYEYANLQGGYYTMSTSNIQKGIMSKNGDRFIIKTSQGIETFDVPKQAPNGAVVLERIPATLTYTGVIIGGTPLALSFDGSLMLGLENGNVKLYVWSGVMWKEYVTVVSGSFFSVADISRDGTYVIVGGSGAPVKTFKWDPSTETYNEYGGTTLYAVNNADSTSINQNGDKAVIGTNTNTSQIYTLADGTWNRRTTVSGTSGEGKVGCVRVANDGRAFATASDSRITFFGDFTNKQYPVGWTQRGNTVSIPSYVKSIALSDDGNYLIAGLYKESTAFLAGIQANAGKVRVYGLSGSTWSQRGADIEYDTANTFFGSAVAISPDGSKFAAGGNGIVRVFKNEVGTTNLKNTISSIPLTPQSSLLEMNADGSRLVVNRTIFDNAVAKGGVDSADALNLSNDGNHLAVEANNTAFLYGINSQGVVSLVGTSISPADSADNAGDYRTNTAYSSTKINVNAANSQLLNLASSYGTTTEICSLTYDPTTETTQRTSTNRILTTESSEITGFASHDGIVISRDGGTLAVYDNTKFSIYNYTNSAWTFARTKTVTSGPYLVVLSHDGSRVAYRDGSLKVENTLTGASLGSISVASLYTYAFKSNTTLALLQGTNDIELYDYDGTNWSLGETISYSGTNSSTSLLWSGDGTRLAAGDSGSNRRVSFFEYDSTLSAPVLSFVQEGSAHTASLQALSGTGDVKVLGTSTGFEIHEASGTATFTGGAATSIDVSIDGTRVVVGTSSKMYVVHKSAGVWTQLGSDITGNAPRVAISRDGSKIFSNDLVLKSYEYASWNQVGSDIDGEAAYGQFGRSVSISSDGTRVAIGAPFNGNGQVRIYSESGGTWSQVGSDIDGGAAYDESGFSISLSSDGTRVAIGAPRTDWGGNDHVRVYAESSGVWNQVGSDIDGEAGTDLSGHSVSMSSDGTRVAIGAILNDGNGSNSGHVRVYAESSGVWNQVGSDIDGEAVGDQFGYSVYMSSDGSRVVIGAPYNDGNGTNSGHVRVYAESSGAWAQVGSDIDGEAASDYFGHSVSMSSDGTRVAIGAKNNDHNGTNSGHVRVYAESGGLWTQVGSDIDGEAANDFFGHSVSMSSDGTRVAIGAILNDGNGSNSGHVRVYTESGGVWNQAGSDIDGEAVGDQSGYAVSMSSDGSRVVIGAPFNTSAGHVRVYSESNGWTTYLPDLTVSGITKASTDGDIVAVGTNVYSKQSVTTNAEYTFNASGSSFSGTEQAVSGNGNVRVVADKSVNSSTGQALIYEKVGGSWSSTASATFTGASATEEFGRDVDVSNDGTRVVIGSATKMVVVEKSGGTWSQLGSDIAGSTAKVAISRDGSKVFAYSGSDMKSYEYVSGSWTQYLPDLTGLFSITRLAPSTDGDIVALSKNNANQVYSKQTVPATTGYTISQPISLNHIYSVGSMISNNGLVAVTADPGGAFSAGEVKIFEKDSSGNWPSTPSATYTGIDPGHYLGRVLGISDDGTRVAMQSAFRMKVVEKPSAATTTYTVTVASVGGGNRYHIDGVDRASLTFYRGNTYVFDLSDASNNGHPLVFSPTTTGVVDNYSTNLPGTTGSQVTFTVPANAPSSMTYLCQTHGSGMGSTITVSDRVWTQIGSDITASFNAITGSCMSGDGTKVFGISANASGSDVYSWEYSSGSWSQYRYPKATSYSSIGRISHSTNGEILGIEDINWGEVVIFSTTSSSSSYSERHVNDYYYVGKYHSLSNDGANLVFINQQSGSRVWNGSDYVYDGASGTQVPWYTTSTPSFVEISRNGNFVVWLDNGTNNIRIYSKSTVNGNVQWTLSTSRAYTDYINFMSPLRGDAIIFAGYFDYEKIYDITYTAGSTTIEYEYATRGSVISGNMIDMSDDGSKVVSWIYSGSMTWNGSTDYAYDGTQVPWYGSTVTGSTGNIADWEMEHNIRISGDGTRVVAASSFGGSTTFLRMWFKSGSSWVDTGVTMLQINGVNTVDVSLNTDGTFFGIDESTQVEFFDVIYNAGSTSDQYVVRGSGLGSGSNHDLSDDGDYVVYTNVSPGTKAWNGSSWAYNGPAATNAGWSSNHTVLALSGDATKAIAFKSTTNEVILYTKDAQNQWSQNATLTQTGVTALSIDTDGSIVGVVANSQTKFYTFGSTQSPIGWYSHSSFQDTAEPGFAQSFDISNDGDAVVVGVSGDGTSSYRGAVRVYDYTSSWALRSTITPPSETASNGNVGYRNFGKSVSVSSDGTKIAYLGDQGTYSGGQSASTTTTMTITSDYQNRITNTYNGGEWGTVNFYNSSSSYLRLTSGTGNNNGIWLPVTFGAEWSVSFRWYLSTSNGADDMRFVFYAPNQPTSYAGSQHGGYNVFHEFYSGDEHTIRDPTDAALSTVSTTYQSSSWRLVSISYNNGVLTTSVDGASGTSRTYTFTGSHLSAQQALWGTNSYIAITGRTGGASASQYIQNINVSWASTTQISPTVTPNRSEASTRDWENSAWVNPAYASDEVTQVEIVPVSEDRDLETVSMSYDGTRFGVRASSGSYDAIVKKLTTLVITTTDSLGWTKRGDIISFDTTDSVAATTSRSMRSSVDGNTVAFGYVNSSGVKIRVYSFASGSWSQLGSEISTTGTTISMDVSNDGTRVAVLSGDTGRVFAYGGGSWSQFGSSIAFRPTGVDTIKISGNGNYVALGNNTPSDPYPFNILRVYKKNVDWELISPTMTLAKTPSNFFGAGFGLLNDGSRLVHYTDSGVEFASFITTVGTDFTQHSTDITGNGVGSNLAFDNSGSTLVTSSFTDNVIRVYDSSHNQVTTFDVKIMYADIEQPFGSPDAMETKPFAITKDGTKIVTVAPPGVSGLRAIVYKKQNGVWSQEGNTIEITVTDRISSVDISSDGNTVIVGSIEEAANGANPCPGRAQAFTLSNGTWSQLGGTITNPEGNHRFSNVVAISDVGTIVAAGHYTYNGGRPFGVVKTYESKDEVQDISFGPPIIQLIGNSYVRLPINVVYEELGATVTTQASIVPEIKITGTVQTGIPGVYTLRYECEDSLRKKATPIFRRVEIISAIQTFRIKGEPIVYHTKDVLYTDQGIEVFSGYEDGTDFEMFYITPGSPFSPILVSNSAFTPTQEGDYTIVWVDQLVDEYLRTGSLHTRIVRVREIPVITLTGGSVIYHRLFDPFVDPGVTITQSSYGFEGTTAATAVNPNLSGVYTITYTAVDKFGIEATPITRTVEVKARPIINITGNQFYHLINNPVSLPPVTVTTPIGYASDLTPSLQSSNDIDQNTEGDYTIQHSLTDATSGISAEQKSQKFSVGSHGRLNFSKTGTAFTFTGTSLVVFDTALRTYDIQTDGTWGLYSTLTVPSTATSIKMTKDGQFMVVGMSSHLTIGLVQVYRRNALFQTGWQQLGFDIFGTDYLGGFGAVVDINNSGTRIVVGAPQVTKTIIKAGLVGVYDWSGFFWNRTKLFEGTLPNELLGFSVSLDSIGTTLALGSPGHSVTTISPGSNITTVNVGKTAVYKLGESDWTLLGLEIQDGPVNKRNGTSVSLSRDGENLVVGSVLGGARVYNLRNNDTWTVQGSQILPNIGGKSVSISGDKGLVAVGSEDEYGGRVYIFRYNQGWSNATETFDKVVTEQDTSLLGKYVVFDDSGALLCLLTDTEVRIYGV
jgi:hypothetical protein